MVKVSRIAKDYTEAGAMNGLIGLWGFLSDSDQDSIFLTKGGEVGVVIRVEGVDAECLDHPQIDQIARRFEAALRIFDERFRVYEYLLKRDQAEIPHREYSNPVVQKAIQNRVAYGGGAIGHTLDVNQNVYTQSVLSDSRAAVNRLETSLLVH